MKDLNKTLTAYSQQLEQYLDAYLPADNTPPSRLHQAIRYAVLGTGKRIRPALVYATSEALGIDTETVHPVAAAIEMMHCYSLIHDDLPAMDDDDLRRGKPTCHKAFDEATAILAGDAIQALAFAVLTDPQSALDDSISSQQVFILAQASGSMGMAGGQALDLAAVDQQISLEELETMHRKKTGCLIHACINMAQACTPQLNQQQREQLLQFGECLGLAFQIRDDILDEIGDTDIIGKPQGSDREQNKPTYVSTLGIDEAQNRCRDLQKQALECIAGFDHRADTLRMLANYIVGRQH